jgi:AcrR family transcriptional regulator
MSPKVGVEPIRQTQIIEAAFRLFAKHGSNNVSIQSVATEAGLSKGAVLHYYPTKNKLFAAVFKEFFRRMFEGIKQSIALCDSQGEKLGSITGGLLDESASFIGIGYPLYIECMALSLSDETYNRLFSEWVNNWVELVATVIEDGVEAGEFAQVDPEETARALSAFCQGVASRWYLDKERHSTEWARKTLSGYTEALLGKG